MKKRLSEVNAWILSYMVGLKPFGEVVHVRSKWLLEDMEDIDRRQFRNALLKLRSLGAIERLSKGNKRDPSEWRVLKRPEEFEIIDSPFFRTNRPRTNNPYYDVIRRRQATENYLLMTGRRVKYAGYDAMEAA